MKQHKNYHHKIRKVMLSWAMTVVMLFSMSAVSYAQFSPSVMGMMVNRTAPVSIENHTYELNLSKAQVKHSPQTVRMLSVPSALTAPEKLVGSNGKEKLAFYPGDTLYIPFANKTSGIAYTSKSRPSNWEIAVSGMNKQTVSNVRWANENGYLTVAVDFASELMQSKPVDVKLNIILYDKTSKAQNKPMVLEASFQNVTREVMPGTVNEVVSPMNMKAGKIYHEQPLTLSFGHNVFLKDAVLVPGETMYLNLDRSFDHKLANQYRSFDIQCYNFIGSEDHFTEPAELCLPAQRNESYVYEVIDGELRRLVSQYDEENGLVCFTTDSLGYYVVSPILMK